MRVWDLPPKILCRNHLLGEHREIHAIWSILTENKKGYSNHPETLRWRGKLKALYKRHAEVVSEMQRRGYSHNSPLDRKFATGKAVQNDYVDSIDEQRSILKRKKCDCKI